MGERGGGGKGVRVRGKGGGKDEGTGVGEGGLVLPLNTNYTNDWREFHFYKVFQGYVGDLKERTRWGKEGGGGMEGRGEEGMKER